jgi:hypothetical protein
MVRDRGGAIMGWTRKIRLAVACLALVAGGVAAVGAQEAGASRATTILDQVRAIETAQIVHGALAAFTKKNYYVAWADFRKAASHLEALDYPATAKYASEAFEEAVTTFANVAAGANNLGATTTRATAIMLGLVVPALKKTLADTYDALLVAL